jgi:hypothetical protein
MAHRILPLTGVSYRGCVLAHSGAAINLDKGKPAARRARKAYGPLTRRGSRAAERSALLTHTLRWSDSRAQRVRSLVLEKVPSLLRCPPERREEVTQEAFSKLRPHVEAELEALETLEWLRELTEEEIAMRRAFAMLVSVVRHEEKAKRSARERILDVLSLKEATNSEIQRRTGISTGTIRNKLFELIEEGEVVGDGGRPKTYRLVT